MNIRRTGALSVAAILAALPLVPSPAAAEIADDYETVLLTPAQPPRMIRDQFVGGISETGYVFGSYRNYDSDAGELTHLAITGPVDDPVTIELPAPVPTYPRPNAAGETVFTYFDEDTGTNHSLLIEADGTVTELTGDGLVAAVAIDDDGTLVGARAECGDFSCLEIVKLPPTGPATVLVSGDDVLTTSPIGIRGGWVHGASFATEAGEPVRWDPAGNLEVLESLGEGASTTDINASGQVSGSVGALGVPGFLPVRWEVDGSMTLLDLGGAERGDALGIADDGTVVGAIYAPDSSVAEPVAWQPDGTLVDLRTHLPAPTMPIYPLTGTGFDVNSAGQVLVQFYDPVIFDQHLAVLDPVVTVESVAVTPASASIAFGDAVALSAEATYSDGATADVSSVAAWSSTDEEVAYVDAFGTVFAAGVGTATISATVDGITGTSEITVTPVATTITAGAERTGGLTATRITYAGVLFSEAGASVAGQSISFGSGPSARCTAVTDAAGVATCSVDYGVLATLLGILFPGTASTPPAVGAGFTATFAGSPDHLGTSDSGTIG